MPRRLAFGDSNLTATIKVPTSSGRFESESFKRQRLNSVAPLMGSAGNRYGGAAVLYTPPSLKVVW